MALQGTIDSFSLSDVMRLLNTSGKTGRLIVNGDRGSASLWIAGGEIVGGSTSSDPGAVDVVEVVFDILRYRQGSFIFENDAVCPAPGQPTPIVPALEQAEAALAEWLEIIRVVPSLDSVVRLADALPHPEVVVDQACWTSIVAVGSGAPVVDLGERLGLGELPICRLVRALVSAGFVKVLSPEDAAAADEASSFVTDEVPSTSEPSATLGEWNAPAPTPDAEAPTDSWTPEPAPAWEEGSWDVPADDTPTADTPVPESAAWAARTDTDGDDLAGVDVPELSISGLVDDPFDPESFPEPAAETDAEGSRTPLFESPGTGAGEASADDEDVADALSMLSPKAAQAVAAASAERPAESFYDDLDPSAQRD